MSLTTSPLTIGPSATTTFSVVDYMKLKQERDIAPFPNMNEWRRAVQVATRAAMKALLVTASHLAGLERLGLEEGGKLSAYPAIGVFKPMEDAPPTKTTIGRWSLAKKAVENIWYLSYFASRLQGSATLGYGAFVGIFGRNGFDRLRTITTDYDCESLLILVPSEFLEVLSFDRAKYFIAIRNLIYITND